MWARIASFVLGLWLMAAPAVIGYADPARTNDHIVGPVVAGFAFIAIWQLMRPLRWIGLVVGAWLLAAPWILEYGTTPTVNSLVVGLLLAVLTFLGTKTSKRFGGGWMSLLSGETRDQR
jgi:SPW repeat